MKYQMICDKRTALLQSVGYSNLCQNGLATFKVFNRIIYFLPGLIGTQFQLLL